jgi:hypothetical protein
MLILVALSENHVNFYNTYLLLLEERSIQMSRQAKCVVTSEVLCGPEKGHNSKAGHAEECLVKLWLQWAGLCYGRWPSLRWQPGDCELAIGW